MKIQRNYGVDLLRLVLMYMVCMLHTLGHGGILYATEAGTIKFKVFWLMEIFSYCAVNGFAIISGYMSTDRPQKYEKLVDMWFQAFFYSFVISVLLTVAGGNIEVTKKEVISWAMPVAYDKFWYFTAFFALFFTIPILNRFVVKIDEKTAKKGIIILIILFGTWNLFANAFKVQNGYSAFWLMILYCIGAFAKMAKVFETKKTSTLLAIWGICIFITWIMCVHYGNKIFVNYISPTMILSGLIMVVLFARIHLKGTIISRLSPLAFGIYLFQQNQIIWEKYLNNAFSFVLNKSVVVGVLYAIICAGVIFIIGLCVEFARSKFVGILKVHQISKRIVSFIQYLLEKAIILFD